MNPNIIGFIFLCMGFALLIKGADFLVDGASSLARKLKVSDLVIGITVVAFGTSTPELLVNITASLKGIPDIAIGNILGSNIANILLILGIAALIYPLKVTQNTISKEIPLSLLATILVFILANDQLIDNNQISNITRIDGFVLISFFIIFIYYIFSITRDKKELYDLPYKQYGILRSIILIFVGLAALIGGAKLVVDNAVKIAITFGLSESLIGLTIVAVGTSLPELMTSAVAAYKKNSDIAVGNVIGSNIFNIFFILGVSAIITPLNYDIKYNLDIGVTILASLLLTIFIFTGRKRMVDRLEGGVVVALYVAYLIFLIKRG